MRELPGGNVTQYAKLLNTTAIRLNTLLHTAEGQKLVKKGTVVVSEKGKRPGWANETTARGSLRARDVDDMVRNDTLPPFIAKLLEAVHPTYRDDTLNFLREALEQTSNHSTFEQQIAHYMAQDKDRTDALVEHQERILLLEKQASAYEFVLAQAEALKEKVTALNALLPSPTAAPTSEAEEGGQVEPIAANG